jgi:hypothetical protein
LFVLLAIMSGVCSAHASLAPAAQWKLPPLDGEFAGEFNVVVLTGAPKLKWKLKVSTPRPRERAVEFSIEDESFRLKVDALVDPMGEGSWRISEAKIDLGQWYTWLAPHFAEEVGTATIGGTLSLNAEGTWRGGELGGHATLSLRDARIDDPPRKVSLEGIALTLVIEDFATRRTAPAQVLTWTKGHYDQVQLGAGRIEFSVADDTVNIPRAAVALFGGELSVSGITFSRKRPDFSVSGQVSGFELGEFVYLLPKILSHARGRVDGYLELLHDANGFALGAGYLGLREGEPAELRLVPTPGILSSALPPSINKAYPGIAKVEREGVPLKAEVLQMRMLPEPDERGRTAWLRVAGRPVDPGFKGPVDLTVNVRGPLDEVINLGANSALRVMGRR